VTDVPLDLDWCTELLVDLLRIPSPTGRTDEVVQFIGDLLTDELGIEPRVTRRGSIQATLPGGGPGPGRRGVVVHADTIGAMVRFIRTDGRLELAPVGTWSARFAEGARVTVFVDHGSPITGTILPHKASGHAYGDEVDEQPVGWDQVVVRPDVLVETREEIEAHGVHVGDHVAVQALPFVTPTGFVNSRHLDDKAGIAALLTAVRGLRAAGVEPAVPTDLLVTITEEVGHGASHGLTSDHAEMLSIDAAVCAPEQTTTETGVTVLMQDLSGPFDFHLTRHLAELAEDHGIEVHRDVFRHYRSDVAAAIEAGYGMRAALIGFGVDATHGHERTHVRSLEATARLLALHLQTPLVLGGWDEDPSGSLADFPSHSVQPAQREPRVVEEDDA
jgi:peptidase M42 family hydrolase